MYEGRQQIIIQYWLMKDQFSSLSQYGEMVTLQMGSKTWVLLNSNRVVTEIIAKRGSITHERPYFPIASGLVSHDKRSVLRQTAEWAEDRRIMHQLLNGHALKTYGVWQEVESVHLLATYVYRPREWYRHHNWYSNSVVHRIVLGERLQRSSPELAAFELTTRQFINSINGNVIDFFPSLVKLPKALQFWRRYWEKLGQFHQSVYQIWWKPVKQAIVEGTAPASFVRDALLHGDTKYTGDDTEAMWLAMGVIAAGSDNIRMTLNTFVMAMLCHPQILQKAQREIDRVCHSCNPDVFRLPGLDDMPLLPYISALIKEILRWRPVVPLIPQHQLTQDLEFEEYHFPRGTDFVINSSAVCAEFEASEEFRPERWLDEQGNEGSITHGLWQFGGGRRICVGYKVAQQELFVAVARLCFCFNFEAVNQNSLLSSTTSFAPCLNS